MSDPNPHADLEQTLLDWQMRLAARERDLNLLRSHLISWGESLTRLARVLDEIRALERREPVVQAASGERPMLRLVKSDDDGAPVA